MVAPDVKEFTAVDSDDCLFPLNAEISNRLEKEFPDETPISASRLIYLNHERGYVFIDTDGELEWHAGLLSEEQTRLLLRADALVIKGQLFGNLEGRDLYLFVRLCASAAALLICGDIENGVAALNEAEEYIE